MMHTPAHKQRAQMELPFDARAQCAGGASCGDPGPPGEMLVGELRLPSDMKPSNPKDLVGVKKVPMSTVPAPVLMEVGLAMLEGSLKYGRHNYRAVGVRSSVYYDALKRHLDAWWEGEDTDAASGLPHLVKAISTLVVLRDATMRGMLEDDRPPPSPEGWMEELNAKAAALIDRYKDHPTPKHYTRADKVG